MPTVALTDDLAEIKPQYRTFADWLASRPEEADEVLQMARDPRVAIEDLVRVLRKNGIPCSKETVRALRHDSL